MQETFNMAIEGEWKALIDKNQSIYIYGAGNIGKKVLRLIRRTENAALKLKGFIVSDLIGNPAVLENYPVLLPGSVPDKDSLILVSVTDIYQDTIMEDLKKSGFVNIETAYKYSFLVDVISRTFVSSIKINTNELLMCQFIGKAFNRYDIIVRLLAIEEYYGKNNYGFYLYQKMQSKRAQDDSYGEVSLQRFIRLIQSYETNGYLADSELIIDKELHLVDGSHRLALAIYFGIHRLTVRIVKREDKAVYGKEWFGQFFSDEECRIVQNRLLASEREWTGTIKGILWPSVGEFFDEIVELIGEQYPVTNVNDFMFTPDKFEDIVYEVYEMDSIAEWKINTKLKYMKPFSPYCIRTFDIHMNNPEFRMKKAVEGILSDKGAKLKEKIREIYKEKITGYFSDIIFHTADNFYQSECIEKIFHAYL